MIEPLPNESEKKFTRFKAYVEMGPKRTMRKLAKQLKLSLEQLRDDSKRYKWQERLKKHLVADSQDYNEAEQQAKLETARENERFRLRVLDMERKTAEMIYSRLEEIQQFPVYRMRMKKDWAKNADGSFILDSSGKRVPQTILMQPLAHSVSDIAKLAQAASALGRMNQGMPTSKHEVTGSGGAPLNPTITPIFNVIIKQDKISEEVKRKEDEFFRNHPEFKRPNNRSRLAN